MRRFDEVDAVAVIWWKRDEYPRMLQIMAAAHKLPVSFEEWEDRAHEAISMIIGQGGNPFESKQAWTCSSLIARCEV